MSSRLDGHSNSGSSSDSRELLLEDLAKLSFGTYLVIIRLLLAKAGYVVAGSLGRDHLRSYKPKGGADLVVCYQSLQGPIKVLVQVKQETRKLQRRYVDELRGVMQRAGVSHGLIITLGTTSRQALEIAKTFPGRPVSILQGDEILRFVRDTLQIRDDKSLSLLRRIRLANQSPPTSTGKEQSKVQPEPSHSPRSSINTSSIVGTRGNAIGIATLTFLLGLIIGAALK